MDEILAAGLGVWDPKYIHYPSEHWISDYQSHTDEHSLQHHSCSRISDYRPKLQYRLNPLFAQARRKRSQSTTPRSITGSSTNYHPLSSNRALNPSTTTFAPSPLMKRKNVTAVDEQSFRHIYKSSP